MLTSLQFASQPSPPNPALPTFDDFKDNEHSFLLTSFVPAAAVNISIHHVRNMFFRITTSSIIPRTVNSAIIDLEPAFEELEVYSAPGADMEM